MIILRDFLFLNTNMLKNYLSSAEGYIESEQSQIETESVTKGGKAGAKIVEGSISTESAREITSKRTLTEAAQFQKLYDILEKHDQLKYLDVFDNEYWNALQREEVLEIQASTRIPTFLMQLEELEEFTPFLEFAKNFDLIPLDDSDSTPLEGFTQLKALNKDKPLPLIFQAASTPGYSFITYLPREYIICDIKELQGEAVVFGKVQRILSKGQKLEVSNLIPDISSISNLNRQQRRKLKSSKNRSEKDSFVEIIRGPAIVLTTLAIYR